MLLHFFSYRIKHDQFNPYNYYTLINAIFNFLISGWPTDEILADGLHAF